jgi:hypothetical protein
MAARSTSLLAALLLVSATATLASSFDDHFENATLRVDFYQYGDAESEHMAIDRLLKQGPWAGPVHHLVDPHPYGRYVVRALDPDTGQTLFERGFDSLFKEYQTTSPAALGEDRVYHETVLLPYPRHPIHLSLAVRMPDGAEKALAETTVDPQSIDIASEPPATGTLVVEDHIGGDPQSSLDIAFVGEGYTTKEIDVFKADLDRFTRLLLGQRPYSELRDRINIRGVLKPSIDSGCDEPTKNLWRSTPVGASFNALGSPRYLLTESNRALRDVAANVPYDALIIMVNHQRYGGGGLYNRYCTFTAHGPFADYLLLHEFGHSFGGLADEYYTSSTAYTDFYPVEQEPLEPNITATLDPAQIKWSDLLAADVHLPIEWGKSSYDTEDLAYQEARREINAAISAAARNGAFEIEQEYLREAEERHALSRVAAVDEFMESSGLKGRVGAFEGAGYVSEGLYRPEIDCLMFSRGVKPFCTVCERAVADRIRVYSGD